MNGATAYSATPTQALAEGAEAALRCGNWNRALDLAREVLVRHPERAEAHFVAGVALLERREAQAAAGHLRLALDALPQRADVAAQTARALSLLQRLPEAVEAAVRALALRPADAYTLDTLGVVFSRAQDHARAAEVFRLAIARMPERASYRFNLGAALTFCGDPDAAEREFEACLALDPQHWRAHSALSQLRRVSRERNHLERLSSLLPAAAGDADALLHLHHALAKEHEDLGDSAAAFDHLRRGKALRRARIGYCFERDAELFAALQAAFHDPIEDGIGHPSAEPIFVVGLPRTGTTLVERILTSHPLVQSAGELQNFGVALKRASGSRTRHLLDPDTIARAGSLDWGALGRAYIDSTRPLTGSQPRFVDKLPHNFLYLGYIARALPRARIVCLRRDPLDTCLSNFRQLFALNTPYFDYALDILDTGRYWQAFDALIAHWRRVLPGRFLEIDYETIVQDQEGATRRLLAHCGLDFDSACLAFERNAAPVATASATQVREPIYRSAIGRWRRYERELAPLRALLGR